MSDNKDLSDNLICAVRAGKLGDGSQLMNSSLLYKLFHGAIEVGCVQIAEGLLKFGIDVNMKFENGYMPLHVATTNKQEKIAKLLISYAADVNANDAMGNAPIFYATKLGDLKMIKLLLTNGANVEDYPQLLNNAVENEHIKIVEILLQHGADVNSQDAYGRTALLITAIGKHFLEDSFDSEDPDDGNVQGEIAKLLLSWGANVNAHTGSGYTVLQSAIESGFVKVVEALLEYNVDVNLTHCNYSTPLYGSARKGNVAISKMLLNRGADVNAMQDDGMTALHIATHKGHREIIEVLLRCGAIANSKTDLHMTPLHIAALDVAHSPLSSSIVKILLKFGADIDSKDNFGRTALHIAAKKGRTEIVLDLLNHGSDINIKSKEFQTPICSAEAGIDFFSNKLLVSYGDDDNFDDVYVDPQGVYACEIIVEILKRHIVKMKTAKLYVSKLNLESISSSDEINNIQDECQKELAYMKSEMINNTNVSYYDILTKDINRLTMYARNENIIQVFNSDDPKIKFPEYIGMIESNFRKGQIRRGLLDQSRKFFNNVSTIPRIPYNCSEKILQFLSDEDLRMLICTLEEDRKQLLEQGYRYFHFLFYNLPEFSFSCTEKIFSYLSDEDLKILIEACKPYNI